MQQKIDEEESAEHTSDKLLAGAETAPITLGESVEVKEENKEGSDDKRK
jgi:hypothetical protein